MIPRQGWPIGCGNPPQDESPSIMRLPEAACLSSTQAMSHISMQRGTVFSFRGRCPLRVPVTLDSRSSMSSTTRLKHQSRYASCTIIRWATTSVSKRGHQRAAAFCCSSILNEICFCETWVQLGSNCCRIRYKTEYYDTEQSQANQLDRFSFSSLQAGGRRFDPGHVHQSSQSPLLHWFRRQRKAGSALSIAKTPVTRSIVAANECLLKKMNIVMRNKLRAVAVLLTNSPSARKPSGVPKLRIKKSSWRRYADPNSLQRFRLRFFDIEIMQKGTSCSKGIHSFEAVDFQIGTQLTPFFTIFRLCLRFSACKASPFLC